MLADAVDAGLLGKNVAAGAKPSRPARRATGGINAWDPDELSAFLAQVRGNRLEAIWRLSTMTGMRRARSPACGGATWISIEPGSRSARRSSRSATRSSSRRPRATAPGSIDLGQETVAQLRANRVRQAAERAEWDADYHDQDLVLAKENGEPIHPHTFSQAFERLIEKAGPAP